MKELINFLFGIIMIVMNFFASGCAGDESRENKETVDTVVTVGVYQTEEKGDKAIPVGSALLEERIRIHEIIRYGDDDVITVPFRFSDAGAFAHITAANVGQKIAIAINGEVVYTPVVQMPIEKGACSFILSKSQALKLFPSEKVDKILPA